MFSNAFTLVLAALALCGTSSAHMVIAEPVPYGQDTLNNSPLQSSSDYPCKQRTGVYDLTKMNNMAVGQNQTLVWKGSATHGGGTCQIAVSLDKKPTKDSTFKIIQTYVGGCPTTGAGNDAPNEFSYSIPEGFPNGVFTWAVVWNNKIGNREIYMNCAPITVTGGSDNKDLYNSLPNLFLVNPPVNPTCQIAEGYNLEIPFPGKFVQTLESTSVTAATGAGCAAAKAAQTSGVSGGTPATGGSSAASAPASSSAQPTSAAAYGGAASSSSPSAYTSAPTSSTAAVPPSSAEASESSFPTTVPATGEGIYGPGTSTASAAIPVGTGTGSSGIICDPGHASKYGQAVNGKTIWRTLAAGTTCSEVQQYRKRSAMRHAHIRRHMQNAGLGHPA